MRACSETLDDLITLSLTRPPSRHHNQEISAFADKMGLTVGV